MFKSLLQWVRKIRRRRLVHYGRRSVSQHYGHAYSLGGGEPTFLGIRPTGMESVSWQYWHGQRTYTVNADRDDLTQDYRLVTCSECKQSEAYQRKMERRRALRAQTRKRARAWLGHQLTSKSTYTLFFAAAAVLVAIMAQRSQ